MADKFNIDDILKEYPKQSGDSSLGKDFDLDAFLSSPAPKRPEQTAEPIKAEKPVEPIKAEKPAEPVKTEQPETEPSVPEVQSAAEDIKSPERAAEKPAPADKTASEEGAAEDTVAYTPAAEAAIEKEAPTEAAPAEPVTEHTVRMPTKAEGNTVSFRAERKSFREELNERRAPTETIHVDLPPKPQSEAAQSTQDIPRPEKKKRQGNTELIEGLMKLRRERSERTAPTPVARKSIQDIDLKLDDKIIPNTTQLPELDGEEKALDELQKRRKKKVADFVLVGDEEDNELSDDYEPEERELEDFESYDDAASIESDIGKLKSTLLIRLLVLSITGALSIILSAVNDFGAAVPDIFSRSAQPTTYIFLQTILGLGAAFSGYTVLSCGVSKLLKFNADADSLCSVGMIASLLSAMVMILSPNPIQYGKAFIFIPVAIFTLLINTIGKLLIVNRAARNFRFVAGDTEKYSVYNIPDENAADVFTKGTMKDFPVLATMRRTEFLTDFIKSSYSPDITDRFCKIAAPVVIAASLICGIVCAIMLPGSFGSDRYLIGAGSFAAAASLMSCMGIMLTVNLPLGAASKSYLEGSGVMLGYDGVEEFSDTNSILLDAAQLFPQGMITLSAIKVFSDTRIDEAIVEAASLSSQANSILKNMFFDIIAGKTELLNPVESYIYEDSMGLCGWINNKRVLLGSRELMINHSISGLPQKSKEQEYTKNGKQAIYLSVAGELSAMFVVELSAGNEIKKYMQTLEKSGIYIMLRSVDSIVSINKLSELFEVSPDILKLIPFRLHESFEQQVSYTARASGTVCCGGKFTSLAQLIVGAKRLRRTAAVGLTIQAASALLGFLLCLILTITNAASMLNPTTVLLYGIIWTLVTVAAQMIRKY